MDLQQRVAEAGAAVARELIRMQDRANETLSALGIEQPPREQAVDVLASAARRLAQREADLLDQVKEREGERAAWKRTAEACSDAAGKHLVRIAELEEAAEGAVCRINNFKLVLADRDSRIASLDFDLAAAQRANEILGGKVHELEERERRSWTGQQMVRLSEVERTLAEKEHQLAMARETIVHWQELDIQRQRVLLDRKERLAASESRGRAYCLELAEKAEEIRALRDTALLGRDLVEILQGHCGETGENEGAVQTLRRIIRERDERGGPMPNPDVWVRKDRLDAAHEESARRLEAFRLADRDAHQQRKKMTALEAAIEDGIAHVEQARTLLDRFGADWHAKTMDALDLAHEALGAAVRVDRGGVPPAGDDDAHLARRVAIAVSRVVSLEQTAFRQSDRMDALDRVLTDHADRLKALEAHRSDTEAVIARAHADGKVAREAHNRLVGRVEALEAGKE